ncbi:MAG TPA: LLM class flavin-dependent oxidoreductase [Candidatus Acidoferrales bacterium]|jgi:alkanesulfonate monooxygenase SsuD/methylene tetrahydromethanopterin reductase-like flavin-dependent oxidoreductase (luciferase family)|nr:LLM class flavin-dependent oxidoreductase [Candidatus Acidoferrales bacterium]
MKVEFGVIDHVDRQDEPIAKTYDSRLKLLELYDKAGFTTFHITEHHSTPLGLAPSPIVFLAAASRITQQIRFAPLVLIATLYNPLRLAAEICMLDHLTKGRFEIGTGRGVSGVELGFFNVREQDAPAMYGEAMEVVMAALTKDVVDFHGKYFDFTNVPIELKPYQLPHPPLWYATNSPESAAKAARQNMNIVTLIDSAEAAKVIAGYKDAWYKSHGASGKKLPRAGVTRFVYVADSDRHAQERGAFGSRKFYESLVYLWRKFNVSAMSLEEVIRSAEATMLAGTPATVRAKIEKDIEVSGANYYVPRFAYGNLTHEESVRSLELFTREVMPHFR